MPSGDPSGPPFPTWDRGSSLCTDRHDASWRSPVQPKKQLYSPECVEGEFSEVRQEKFFKYHSFGRCTTLGILLPSRQTLRWVASVGTERLQDVVDERIG